jgi:hypothetical protein
MKKPKIYLAGAYSDVNVLRVLKNIGRGQYWAAELFMEGFAPFSPWADRDFVFLNWRAEFSVKDFYEYSIEWLLVSDAVFVVPNEEDMKNWEDSVGVKGELHIAYENNIPVFFDLDSLLNWQKTLDNS